MISCTTIGTNGRLGNQMFQFAALLGAAKATGKEIHFSPGRLYEAFKMTGIVNKPSPNPLYIYREKNFSFCKEINNIPDDTEIFGYFQSSKYWNHIENEIINAFDFKDENISSIDPSLVNSARESTSLHIRRTDYLTSNGFHPIIGIDYIINSLDVISSKLEKKYLNIFVFTDDPDGIKDILDKIISLGHKPIIISKILNNDIQELYLMTQCNSAIIANSSFSWWGAYLGPQKRKQIVIAPNKWFGQLGPQDTQDIYCKDWLVL
jgi:hypothetical protein